jgi:energy-coupling factor transporter ATP-binding protein EcfA2
MPFEYIKKLDIEDYGCVKQASFALTPLHALIGPNDSGKSTTLRALRTITRCATEDQPGRTYEPRFESMWGPRSEMKATFADDVTYQVFADDLNSAKLQIAYRRGGLSFGLNRGWEDRTFAGPNPSNEQMDLLLLVWRRLLPATMIRFDPNMLRGRWRQLLSEEPIRFFDETGTGLSSVYQAINSRDVDAFVGIRDRVRKLFPTIQNILVPTMEGSQVALQAKLTDGTFVPAEGLSEGLLYFLGFVALQHLGESQIFLVEEPENGLHPARIAEVMAILREISKTSQVIIATHSPLVVNELKGDEISIVTRDPERGTQVKLLKDVPGFDDASKVYLPGEFWVSYCDGNMEAPLLTGSPRL